jgi:hypothetical protein
VYEGEDRVLSTLQEYERMRLFNITEGKVSCVLRKRICYSLLCLFAEILNEIENPLGNVSLQKGRIRGVYTYLVYEDSNELI